MMQSLYTASTGMLGMQTQIDTTANNIANVNTPGFKYSRANFSNLLSTESQIFHGSKNTYEQKENIHLL